MKVICINKGHVSPLAKTGGIIKEGEIYTVRCEETGYSNYAKRIVEAYGFEETDGLYEKTLFMPLSNLDEQLIHLLRTKPVRQKIKTA